MTAYRPPAASSPAMHSHREQQRLLPPHGTQLSGFVTTGEDDFQDPQNFPVVYLTNAAGDVYYARSYNFSTMAPSTPGEAEPTDLALPSGLPHGVYSLFVSACGISCATGYSFTY